METNEALDKIKQHWPGVDLAIVDLISLLEQQLASDWQVARIKAEGPEPFMKLMQDKLQEGLVKVDHAVLSHIAAEMLAPLIFKVLAEIGAKNQEAKRCK